MDLHTVDLARLVAMMAQEVIAQTETRSRRCGCHSVMEDCCPDRMRSFVEAGAVRLGMHAAGGAPEPVAGLIDHTLLKPDASRAEVEQLCREAREFRFATVCVNPTWVGTSMTEARYIRRLLKVRRLEESR